jgi:hypothetical protein
MMKKCNFNRYKNYNHVELENISSELVYFEKLDAYDLSDFKNFPILGTLAKKYLIILATLVASESEFSVSGYIQRKQRASLNPEILEYLMVCRNQLLSQVNDENQIEDEDENFEF